MTTKHTNAAEQAELIEILTQAHAAFSFLSAKTKLRADKDEFAARALKAWNMAQTLAALKAAKGETT